MRTFLLVAVLAAVLAAGCGKKNEYSDGGWGEAPTKKTKGRNKDGPLVERGMPANGKEIAQILADFFNQPQERISDAAIMAIDEPKSLQGGKAQAYYVQFVATNNQGERFGAQNWLFIIRDGKVAKHMRTPDEIREVLGSVWLDKNPPPNWPSIDPEVKKSMPPPPQ